MQKNIVLFGDSDSQLFGLLPHAFAFRESGWKVCILVDDTIAIPASALHRVSEAFRVTKIKIEALPEHIKYGNFDVAGIFSRASKLHRFRYDFAKQFNCDDKTRPGIFTGNNGLTYEKFEEGLTWRLGYDVIALNGPRDQILLQEFIKFSPCHAQPSVITGLAQNTPTKNATALLESPDTKEVRKSFVFAEQVVVPTTKAERRYLVCQLLQIATNNPDWDILIKCRVRKSEKTFHDVKHHLENILREFKDRPKNLRITYTPLPELLKTASLFGTISSTALFEALNMGVPSIVVSDFGVKNSHGTHIFANSGISVKLAHTTDLRSLTGSQPSTDWLNWVGAANVNDKALVSFFEAQQFSGAHFQPQHQSEADIKIWSIAKKNFRFSPRVMWLLKKLRIIENYDE